MYTKKKLSVVRKPRCRAWYFEKHSKKTGLPEAVVKFPRCPLVFVAVVIIKSRKEVPVET